MKSKIFIALISLCIAIEALGCSDPIYFNQDLRIYRALPDGYEDNSSLYADMMENLSLWQKATGQQIATDSIRRVAYKMSLAQLQKLSKTSANPFVNWLMQSRNMDAYDCLLLAKEVEEIRENMRDVWYYPVSDDANHQRLDSLLNNAKQRMSGRFASRYAVQIARILSELKRNVELASFWERYQKTLAKDVLRRMVADYAGGAYERLGKKDEAIKAYVESQNILALSLTESTYPPESWQHSLTAKVKQMTNVFDVFPNHPSLKQKAGEMISQYENRISAANKYWDKKKYRDFQPGDSINGIEDYRSLRTFAVNVAQNKSVDEPGFWHYTASYLYYLDGQYAEAANELKRAERTRKAPDVAEAIRAYRILFEIATKPSSQWTSALLGNLKWLDGKMAEELNQTVLDMWKIENGYAVSYWLDATRKICETAADKLENDGKGPLGALVSNYGLNRPFQLAPTCVLIESGQEDGICYIDSVLYMSAFRNVNITKAMGRGYDYSNPYFARMDSLSAREAARYARMALTPSTSLQKFLSKGGCNDSDYICEHVGTLYLREKNYAKAVEWLTKVSPGYQYTTNVYFYMDLDPFRWLDKDLPIADRNDYKLQFAKRMLALEKEMRTNANPDRRAQAKIRYAIGLRNSFGRCWALTQYYFSGYPQGEDDTTCGQPRYSEHRSSFSDNSEAMAAYKTADRLIAEAMKEFTTPELAAQAQLEMKNFKTVVTNYPNSHAAAFVRGHCDKYYDYVLQKR